MSAAPAASSNAPSPEYLQHHRVEEPRIDAREFRPAWRVKNGLDQLLAGEQITGREWQAAIGFRATYERALRGAVRGSQWGRVYIDRNCRQPRPERSDSALDAIGRIRVVERALGGLYPVLIWCVVEGLCWAAIADRLGVDPRTAKAWAAASIAGLAAV